MNDEIFSLSPSATDYAGRPLLTDMLPRDSEDNIYIGGAKNDKLSFGSNGAESCSIARIEELHDVTLKIIWAEESNGDGLSDMILNLSDDCGSYHLYFFLSDKKDKDKPLKNSGSKSEK